MDKLIAMDEKLKKFLYEKLHDDEITSKEQIIMDGYIEGFDQLTILNALQICADNNLIQPAANPLNIGSSIKDFFINSPELYKLKS
ncbi:hypothetical protein OCB08_21805 [Bacillus cereus]|uniref:hypothetical protein n=1 Tax=Bacillus TaxID=1386 RepID=UPI001D0E3325|nr:hypothetical protein [Bacillus cereus]MCC2370110.1 hypothetical protein [Bacillus cereus]MCC2490936.1 hypothetical protein [Bacillus cereus]MCU5627995.1 hypothetical protein [Bacillus cereus]MDF9552952.1 hypothetical protein [Bacillus cereus]MDF9604176.1 hypothetical protein [Bacillus cereus]